MAFISRLKDISRREFLRRQSTLASVTPAVPWAMGLAGMGEAAAQAATDYKALVCVFLGGGNDHAQTIIPYDDASYAKYAQIRGGLALNRVALSATVLGTTAGLGRQFALAPEMSGLHSLFQAGKAAVLANVGTLMEPTTKAGYAAKTVQLPPKLFSHNDQQAFWQTGAAEGASPGWGGKLADLFLGQNSSNAMFTCMSTAGNTAFLSGQSATQFQVSPQFGAIPVGVMETGLYGNTAVSADLTSMWSAAGLLDLPGANWAKVVQSACRLAPTLNKALAKVANPAGFPAGDFGDQLKMVARLIATRSQLGMKRQVFFVNLTGFDVHDGVQVKQPALLAQLSQGLSAFEASMSAMGLSNSVTAFTASDFGRTLSTNGDGTDHGWGSHHFVVGGAVAGRQFHGLMPSFSVTSDEQVGFGRYIPTTSVDQMAASLSRWFGVPESALPVVLPALGRFDSKAIKLFSSGV